MRIGAAGSPAVVFGVARAVFFIATANLLAQGLAAESTHPPSKESFNLILPFKDLTVGQGQEATMDAEVVNRSKDPVEVSLNRRRPRRLGCELQFPLSKLPDPFRNGSRRRSEYQQVDDAGI